MTGGGPEHMTSTGTVVIPAYNEGETVAVSLRRVVTVLESYLTDRRWEILVVDDGSADDTAQRARVALAARGAASTVRIRVLRHPVNLGLGGALRTGFRASTGDVVVVLDCDLSYEPQHIIRLVRALEESDADVVVASPYMAGGGTREVPWVIERRSRLANSFLAAASNSGISTLTGMVRAYRGPFVRGLALKSTDDNINIEVLYKTQVLRGRIEEIPAVLDWSGLSDRAARTRSFDRRVRAKTCRTLVNGLLFRPYMVFALGVAVLAGLGGLLGLAALLTSGPQVGLTALAVSLTGTSILVSFAGLLSIQVKRCFEELYYLHGHDRVEMSGAVEESAAMETAAITVVREARQGVAP